MRLLYIAPFLNVPPRTGAEIRAFHLVKGLAQNHLVSLITYATDESIALREWASEHLQYFVTLTPNPWHVTSKRWTAVLNRILAFPPESFSHFGGKQLASAIEDLCARTKPDVIIFDTLMTGQIVLQQHSKIPAVISLYDIASSYAWQRFVDLRWRPYKLVYAIEWLKTWLYERAILRAFEIIAVVSQRDAQFVRKMNSKARILLVPNGVDSRAVIARSPGRDILLVGNFDYAPNVEGLWHFYRNILPLLRTRLDNFRFLVVGRNPPTDFVCAVQGDASIEIAANVPDVRPYYARARLCIAPLLHGAGTRLKILEAASMRVPVVSTSIGCEGLEMVDGETLLIADGADSFANAIVRVFNDTELADRLANQARQLVEARYDWEIITRAFKTELEQIGRSS
jgi:glycosyltransferase involved in cell wall biosynthesis